MAFPRIINVNALQDYCLRISFDDGRTVIYDMKEDIATLPGYDELLHGLFPYFEVDKSRTCISWSERIDLPSDTLYEYGVPV